MGEIYLHVRTFILTTIKSSKFGKIKTNYKINKNVYEAYIV